MGFLVLCLMIIIGFFSVISRKAETNREIDVMKDVIASDKRFTNFYETKRKAEFQKKVIALLIAVITVVFVFIMYESCVGK